MEDFLGITAMCAMVAFIISIPLAWITHVIWWISLMMNEEMDTIGEGVLAILGTLAFPIGVIHGYVIWFT